jgi:hypothetical protein
MEVNPAHQAAWRSQAQNSDALGDRLGVTKPFPSTALSLIPSPQSNTIRQYPKSLIPEVMDSACRLVRFYIFHDMLHGIAHGKTYDMAHDIADDMAYAMP